MTTTSTLTCDFCGRDAPRNASGFNDDSGWGIVQDRADVRITRDVCPTCIAKLGGWKP